MLANRIHPAGRIVAMNLFKALFSALLVSAPVSARADITIKVSRADQTMDVVITNDTHASSTSEENVPASDVQATSTDETYHWSVSTGLLHHSTPTGTYTPNRLVKRYRSKKYRASMPYSIFFIERYGIAIHAATGSDIRRLGHVASHGCVHLAPENAKLLYERVQEEGLEHTTIIIS